MLSLQSSLVITGIVLGKKVQKTAIASKLLLESILTAYVCAGKYLCFPSTNIFEICVDRHSASVVLLSVLE